MIKAVIVILALAAAGLAAAYYLGGIASHNPTETGRNVKAAIQPPMTWRAVLAEAGPPRKFQLIEKVVKKGIDGEPYESIEPTTKREFDEAGFSRMVADGELPHGFIFEYMFSYQVAFAVVFGPGGTVEDVYDLPTMADLLDTRQPS